MRIFGPKEWKEYYGINVDAPVFDETVFNEPCPFEKGRTIQETHYIFFGPSKAGRRELTIARWSALAEAPGHPRIFESDEGWWNTVAVGATRTCRNTWYALYAGLVPDSDQQIPYTEGIDQFVPGGYLIPTGIELVTAHLTHIHAFGRPLLTNKWAWSSDDSDACDGHNMVVGHFSRDPKRGSATLRINKLWIHEERGSVGFQPIRILN